MKQTTLKVAIVTRKLIKEGPWHRDTRTGFPVEKGSPQIRHLEVFMLSGRLLIGFEAANYPVQNVKG